MKRYRIRRSRHSSLRRQGVAVRRVRGGRSFPQIRRPSSRTGFGSETPHDPRSASPPSGPAEPLLILDAQARVQLWSRSAARRFHLSAQEAVGNPISAILSAPERRLLSRGLSHIRNADAGFVRLPAPVASTFFPELTLTALSSGNGDSARYALSLPAGEVPAASSPDPFSERETMEEALARAEREKEAILNGLGDVFVAFLDRNQRIRWCNTAMAEKFNTTRDALIGKPCYRVVRQLNRPCHDCAASHSLRSGRFEEKEITLFDGRTFLTRGNPVRNGAGEIIGIVHAGVEITSRKEAERQLQWELRVNRAVAELSEGLLSTDFSVADVARLILDHAKSLTESPHGFVAAADPDTGNMISHTLTDMLAGECRIPDAGVVFSPGPDGRYPGMWGHALNTMSPFFVNDPNRRPARGGLPPGHLPIERFLAVPVAVADRPAGLIGLANSNRPYTDADLEATIQLGESYALALQRSQFERERADLLQQLQQSQKLEAIGALAGGIAHDFNNILFPIIGYAEMALDDTAPDHPHRQFLSQILKGASRAQDLVMQILTFSRQTEGERRPLRVQAILKEVLKLIRSTLPTTIEVRRQIAPDCGSILADPTQIHSVVMNLITNAYHAMAENGGVLTVALENRRITAAESRPGLREGRYVLLTIADTGSGMGPEVRTRAFDPYFTTKGPGQGTGLGLSVVHGVVQSCHGHIEMDTAPGRGATFRIYLPRTDGGDGPYERSEAPEPGGGEHILVVDDEAAITEMIRRMLEGLGYVVTVRNQSLKALDDFQAAPDRFDLMIVDMTMPGLRGDQLTRRMREIRPDLPVILLSGFSELLTDERAEALGLSDCLKKPVLRSDLSRSIRKALARAAERPPRAGGNGAVPA
ncbi:MAG: ATP-binding protein [Desulfococcaceae bacterium]